MTAPARWTRSALVNGSVICLLQLWYALQDTFLLPLVVVFGPPFMRQRSAAFRRDVRLQALLVSAQLAAVVGLLGWRALAYLFCAQLFLFAPLHPFFAFISTSHGAREGPDAQPTTSIDAGAWFTVATFGLNHHLEHHDFPEIPWHRLPRLRRLAPGYYPAERRNHGVVGTILRALRDPPVYAAQGLALAGPDPEPSPRPGWPPS